MFCFSIQMFVSETNSSTFVFELRIIILALVFSSISYKCDRWSKGKHTTACFSFFFILFMIFFCTPIISFSWLYLQKKESNPGTVSRDSFEALATAASSPLPIPAAVSDDSS